MTEELSLETPLIVNLAAVALGMASAFLVMLGVQVMMSGLDRAPLWILALVASYFIVGVVGVVLAGLTAKGSRRAAFGGFAICALIFALFWTPFIYGVLAVSPLASAAFAGLALLLLIGSIGPLGKLTEARERLRRELEAP